MVFPAIISTSTLASSVCTGCTELKMC